ncbi:MAG: methylated-DNA--[protein]-cysteine S-methyltransferase [Gemmatimonas sp.]|nr:methylated-DNA--[protein]-cysteine S-methyltransferase [Gemmatimonas sp.]
MTETRYYDIQESPIGDLRLTSDGEFLTGIWMLDPDDEVQPRSRTGMSWVRTSSPFKHAREQLIAYFTGGLSEFTLPLATRGTPFQMRVWEGLRSIPYGQTISYGELAHRIGDPKAVRAVGSANGRNPLPIVLPCHRVIGADGSLTGYGGGLDRKRTLLELEGVALAGTRQAELFI